MSGYRSSETEIGWPADVAAGKVVALEHLRDGHHARQPDHVGEAEAGEPLAVAAHLGSLGNEDLQRLLEVGLGVPVDLLVGEHRDARSTGRTGRRSGRVVADDEHARVALVLERTHALQRDPTTDVDVRRRDVDTELDAKGAPEGELLLECSGRQDVHGVPRELGQAHRATPA